MTNALTDLIDRRATPLNRLWLIFTGLWLTAVASRLPDLAGTTLIVVAVALLAAGAGVVEVALAVWRRYLQDPISTWLEGLEARRIDRTESRDHAGDRGADGAEQAVAR